MVTARSSTELLRWDRDTKRYTREKLAGKRVLIVADPKGDRGRSYGRLLVYVFVDETNVNRKLLNQGFSDQVNVTGIEEAFMADLIGQLERTTNDVRRLLSLSEQLSSPSEDDDTDRA